MFDPDGTGAGAAIQFATMSPGLALTASEFVGFERRAAGRGYLPKTIFLHAANLP
jgi:hypothetical protein